MFETRHIEATPGNARKLMLFNQLKGTPVSPAVVELAAEGKVRRRLDELSLDVSPAQEIVLQRITDWAGRGMVLIDHLDQAKDIAMLIYKMSGLQKVLVIAGTNQYSEWARRYAEFIPTEKICVFGNPRHRNNIKDLPAGVKFSDSPDLTADIMITSFMSIVYHDLVENFTPDQVFVEEFSNAASGGNSTWKYKELLTGLFSELPSPLFFQNVTPYRNNGTLVSNKANRYSNLAHNVERILEFGVWAGTGFPGLALLRNTSNSQRAMQAWGYGALDMWSAFPLFGVSTELIDADTGPIIDHIDPILTKGFKRYSGFTRILEREQELLTLQGTSASCLVRSALAGNQTSKTLLESLRTVQWANAKATSVRSLIEEIGLYPTHSLIIANNPNLRRALELTLSFTDVGGSSSCASLPVSGPGRETMIRRYCYPSTPDPICLPAGQQLKPVNSLIVSIEDLDNASLLHITTNIVFGEWPLDRAIFDVVKDEYAEPNDCRIVVTSLATTIEEEIRNQLINQ